ncbi:MAG: 16S rRNA (cytosine(1402)-N(4))-methyltransferase RsmH [Dongiaceae bacterium]
MMTMTIPKFTSRFMPLVRAMDDRVSGYRSESAHIPVMLQEVLQYLQPKDGEVYVDATFGHGGYTRAILEAADCRVIALDRDPEAIRRAEEMAKEFHGRLIPRTSNFGNIAQALKDAGHLQVNGMVFDLGVSSSQIDQAERGFSFRYNGPLDMRMDMGRPNAADVIHALGEDELERIISEYGEEKFSRRIAKQIVDSRRATPITTTQQLADLVRSCVPRSKDGLDPATRTFQALRIYVNDELLELEQALTAAPGLLRQGGRLVMVSFHSLEDRIVKGAFQHLTGKQASPSRHEPMVMEPEVKAEFDALTKKPATPADSEVRDNPRAASAKLRAIVKTFVKESASPST